MTPAAARLLIADDESSISTFLRDVLTDEGYAVTVVESGPAAVAAAEQDLPHLAILDLMMPGGSGLDALPRIKAVSPETRVIIMTAFATVETALEAMKAGALDYLIKPFSMDEIKLHVRRALGEVALEREVKALKRDAERATPSRELLGDSPQMKQAVELLTRVAPTGATVLLRGETGTGKEIAARMLHRLGLQGAGTFLAVNCGAMPETLLERELFGHEKGAFTGADATRPGLLEATDGGTLFLDEIAEMPVGLQVKLLRVLEGAEFLRVGGTRPIRARTRFIAATHQDLRKAVAEKRFREDLFYRLDVVAIDLPPLRSRDGDAALLADKFVKEFCASHGRRLTGLTPTAKQRIAAYDWPGNVRELRNVLERAVLLAKGPAIEPADLHLDGTSRDGGLQRMLNLPLQDAKAAFEKAYLEAALRAEGGNVSRTATRTGADRKNIQDKLKRHGLRGKPG